MQSQSRGARRAPHAGEAIAEHAQGAEHPEHNRRARRAHRARAQSTQSTKSTIAEHEAIAERVAIAEHDEIAEHDAIAERQRSSSGVVSKHAPLIAAGEQVRHHHCRGAQQLLRRQSSTLDGGTLKVARCSSAARSTVWCARRRCARRFLARLTCFTEPRSSPSSLDAAVITASLSDLCVPFGGRQLCTSRIIYLRVAGPAVTSVGTSSRIY